MKVRQLMTQELITIGPEASLKEAARRMIESGVSGLPVTDDEQRLLGIITEADFVKTESGRRANKRARLLRWLGRDEDVVASAERLVEDVMTPEVVTLDPEADHPEAARLMRKAGVKRIPITEDNRLVGIVSRSDILRAFARPDAEIIDEIVEHVIGDVLWIDARRVDVRCVEGNVRLRGRLETKSDATLLEEMTRRIDGVASVDAKLTWEIDNTKVDMAPVPSSPYARSGWR